MNNELCRKAIGVARTLTYNADGPQADAKHLLQDLAHRLERARGLNCDQVSWMLSAIERYLPPADGPRVSRKRSMSAYALLYELMEVAGLQFEDERAAHNATPPDVALLQRKPDGPIASPVGNLSGAAARQGEA